MPFRCLKSKTLYTGRVFTLDQETWKSPEGSTFQRQTIVHPGAVAIMPFDKRGRLILIRQYRPATRRYLLEIPAGTLEPGEQPLPCAKRELAEEIGHGARRWKKLGAVYTAPGFCSERIVLFKAWNLFPQEAEGDEDEYIETATYTPAQVKKAVKTGKICDAKTLSALLLVDWL